MWTSSVKDIEATSPQTTDTLSISLGTIQQQPALPPWATTQCLTLVMLPLFFFGSNTTWPVEFQSLKRCCGTHLSGTNLRTLEPGEVKESSQVATMARARESLRLGVLNLRTHT